MTRASKKIKSIPKKKEEITNDLHQKIKVIWRHYAFIPSSIYVMRDMMRALKALKLSDIQIYIYDGEPTCPCLRFTYRGKTYVWAEAFMLVE